MHYLTFVLTETGAEEEIEIVMEPYDENFEVSPYKTDCWCAGEVARRAVRENPSPELASIESRCEEVGKRIGEIRRTIREEDGADALQALHVSFKDATARASELDKQRIAIRDGLFSAHPLANKSDPECEECSGEGTVETTQNQDGRWDWFEVGGRWNGTLEGNCQTSTEVQRLVEEDEIGIPYAVITPTDWHDLGSTDRHSPEEALKEFQAVLRAHEGLMVSVVDCHS